jgi:hypothetical protein
MTPAAIVTELVDIFVFDLDERGYLAVFAGLTLLLGWAQTLVENHYGKAFLRKVPPYDVPVTDTTPPSPPPA